MVAGASLFRPAGGVLSQVQGGPDYPSRAFRPRFTKISERPRPLNSRPATTAGSGQKREEKGQKTQEKGFEKSKHTIQFQEIL